VRREERPACGAHSRSDQGEAADGVTRQISPLSVVT
jgi:hypothetical protein